MKETCPYCGKDVVTVHSSVIYGAGHDYGLMRACQDYPACNSYAGRGASLANRELRELRKRCHLLLDSIWKRGHMNRGRVYVLMAKKMGIPQKRAHIAMFRDEECRRLLDILDPKKN